MRPARALIDGAWRARWGHHAVCLVKRDRGWAWGVRGDDGGLFVDEGERVFSTAVDAVHHACRQLERLGCRAVVDGERQGLSRFLAFEPVDAAEVAFIL